MRRYFEIDGFPENLTAKDLAAFITSARFAITSKLDSIRELKPSHAVCLDGNENHIRTPEEIYRMGKKEAFCHD